MVYMVDAHIRGSTVQLVSHALREEMESRSKIVGELRGIKGTAAVLSYKMTVFYSILKKVIEKKLSRYDDAELEELVLLSDTLLAEGHGSIEVRDPPTVAQEKIIKSLVKVIFHQISVSQNEDVEPGQANLLLSLFVSKIYCDKLVETCIKVKPRDNLNDRVRAVMNRSQESVNYWGKPVQVSRKNFTVNLFCCLEEIPNFFVESKVLSEEFDKIDLDDEEDSEGDTFGPSLVPPGILNRLPLSRQTFSQTRVTLLPSRELEGLWESLYFEDRIKQKLYSYATIALKIAKFTNSANETSNAFANNKLLLVQGPPGTGKTTVCKALCQKLSIRKDFSSHVDPISNNYKGVIIEIPCSRIFSRWFGESSKNLTTIFADVENLLKAHQDDCSFICLLIDEVESIAFSRNSLMNKSESTDGVRVVSTLLTQLDLLKKYNNFLVLATTNLLDSLDSAFIDRADGVFYIGNPSKGGIARILTSSLDDLISKKIISSEQPKFTMESRVYKEVLMSIADKCSTLGISGRTLRKLPLICLSEHFRELPVEMDSFLLALAHSVADLQCV